MNNYFIYKINIRGNFHLEIPWQHQMLIFRHYFSQLINQIIFFLEILTYTTVGFLHFEKNIGLGLELMEYIQMTIVQMHA